MMKYDDGGCWPYIWGGDMWGVQVWGGALFGANSECMFLILNRNILRDILSLFIVIGKVRWASK